MNPIITGLAGFGSSARIFHAPFLTSLGGFKLKGVVERQTAESNKKYPWVDVHKGFESLLADQEIELVIISTPNATHFEFAKLALEAGKHVVVEKPFTVTATEGSELIRLAEKAGKILTVYHNRRLDGDFLTLQSLLVHQRLGRLVEGEIRWERFANSLRTKMWKEENQPGSTLLDDIGSHLLDQAVQLLGLPKRLYCHTDIQRDSSQTADAFTIHLYYPGVTLTLKAGLVVREPAFRYAFHGTSGSFVKKGLDPQEAQLAAGWSPTQPGFGVEAQEHWGLLNVDQDGVHFKGPVETLHGNYGRFYANLHEAIRRQGKLLVSPQGALDIVRLTELCRLSAKDGKTVTVEKF